MPKGNNLKQNVSAEHKEVRMDFTAGKAKAKDGKLAMAENFIRFFRIIFALVVIIGLIAVGLCLYQVYESQILNLQTRISEKENVSNLRQAQLDKLKSANIDYDKLEASSQKIVDVLPSQKDLSSVLIQLESIAGKNNIDFTSLNIAESGNVEAGGYVVHKVNLTLILTGGDYATFKNYLYDVEKNLRLMDIESIVYTPTTNQYNLTISTYYLTEAEYEEDDLDEQE
jgi:Tfp pilus assembly protein PilO